jgi:hypothetical protein
MRNEGRSWEYIFAALPNRSENSIRVRYSIKFNKRPRTGAVVLELEEQPIALLALGLPISEKVEPSSSGDGDDSSDRDPDFSSDNGDSSEAEQGRSSTSKHSQWSSGDFL